MYSVQVVIGEGGFGRVLSVIIGNEAFAVKEIEKVSNWL
jgi:acetyl-CoA carboxylase alpha subunit